MQEMREKRAREEAEAQRRFFGTTAGTAFIPKDITTNIIGRRVMRTQDGKGVQTQKDDLLKAEHGDRPQKVTDDELKQTIKTGADYTTEVPVTLYTEALQNKAVVMSDTTREGKPGVSPFAKTCSFTEQPHST